MLRGVSVLSEGLEIQFFSLSIGVPFRLPCRGGIRIRTCRIRFQRQVSMMLLMPKGLPRRSLSPATISQAFLYALGLSDHWEFPGYRPSLRDEQGRGIAFVIIVCLYIVHLFSFLTLGFVCPHV